MNDTPQKQPSSIWKITPVSQPLAVLEEYTSEFPIIGFILSTQPTVVWRIRCCDTIYLECHDSKAGRWLVVDNAFTRERLDRLFAERPRSRNVRAIYAFLGSHRRTFAL